MVNLDDAEEIKKIDSKDAVGSTDLLPQQLKQAWDEVDQLRIQKVSDVKNIIFCGMGASIYGALVLKALCGNDLPYPMETISDYHLPKYADKNTLIVLTSYSGTTEEVLSCASEAKDRNCRMLILTHGGPLAEFAKDNDISSYIFDGKLNPCGVPRYGNGYTVVGLLALLQKAGVIDIDNGEILSAIDKISQKKEKIRQKAKNDAELFREKVPVIFAAEHLSGNAQILRNQFNETSKTFSAFYLIPDLNHHLMEGLAFPKNSNLLFTFLDSHNYSSKIQTRVKLTREVVLKNNQQIHDYKASGANKIEDFLEIMVYGAYLTLFLGLLHGQDPAPNPWVDYFKAELKK